MREVELNFSGLAAPEAVQEYLQETFGFPDYYGRNLDALYDELTSVMEETRIVFAESADESPCGGGTGADRAAGGADALQGYLKKVRRVIGDAAEENRNLHL